MTRTRVHIVSLGCARNEVDSDELAGRLEAGGFVLVAEPAEAEVVVVNTCGFIEPAKKDSIDALLAAADLRGTGTTRRVVAVGCLAERYGRELAVALPEADAVLGFDAYPDIDERLRQVMAGVRVASHAPADRRRLLPLAPAQRRAAASGIVVPGMGPGGTDAGPIHLTKEGIPTLSLSVPGRYAHTAAMVIRIADWQGYYQMLSVALSHFSLDLLSGERA